MLIKRQNDIVSGSFLSVKNAIYVLVSFYPTTNEAALTEFLRRL